MSENIISKRCEKCKETKPNEEFHKDRTRKDGLHSKCKECVRAYQRSDKGKAARQRASKKYAHTENGKERLKAAVGKYKEKFPEKKKAKRAVSRAISREKIPSAKQLICSCGENAQQYHHLEYVSKKGLNIVPKCVSCHKMLHIK